MNDLPDDRLDVLMRDWAARQAASSSKLDDLARRIGEQLNDLPEANVVAPPAYTSRRRLAWLLAGGAIAASIALFIFVVRPSNSSVAPDTSNILRADRGGADNGARRSLDELELAEKAQLARELQQEFPGRFAWLMESGNEMKLGLSGDDNMRPSRFIAVRFVIESQGPDDRVWKKVQALDFITQSEETVQTSLAPNSGARVTLWTYTTPDGLISVDSELTLSGPLPIRISSSILQPSGMPAEIWRSERNGVKYRVYQAAHLLDDEQLG